MVAYSNSESELDSLSDYYNVFTHDLKNLEAQFQSVLKEKEETGKSCNDRIDKNINPVKLDVPVLSKESENHKVQTHEKKDSVTPRVKSLLEEEITTNDSSVTNEKSIDSEQHEPSEPDQEMQMHSKKKPM